MGLGVFIAWRLAPPHKTRPAWTSFGRLRPLHTNAVIFAFGGCALFATSFYSVQRTADPPVCSRWPAYVYWGWQAVMVLAAISLPLGLTS